MIIMDITVCMLFHKPEWVPWGIYQCHKQHKYLAKHNFSVSFIFGVTQFPASMVILELPKYHKLNKISRVLTLKDEDPLGTLRNNLCDAVAESCKYIAFMDSDDWYPDYRLYRQWINLDITHAKYIIDVTTVDNYMCYDVASDVTYWSGCASESTLFFSNEFYTKGDGFSGPKGEAQNFIKNSNVLMDDKFVLILALTHGNNTCHRTQNDDNFICNGLPSEVSLDFTEKEWLVALRDAIDNNSTKKLSSIKNDKDKHQEKECD